MENRSHQQQKNNIILCEIGGKNAYKKGENGYCYTFNKSENSRRKAYKYALNSYIKTDQETS